MADVKIALSIEEYEALIEKLESTCKRAEFFERAALQFQDELNKVK